MSTATAMNPWRLVRDERDMGVSFAAALAIHLVLIAGLLLAVRWKTEPPAPVYAELWAPAGGGAPVPAPVPAPQPAPPPPPPPKAAEAPEPPRAADIAVKTEPPKKKPEPPREEKKKPEPARKPEPAKKAEPAKPAEPRPDPAAERREAQAAEQRRQAELARVMGQSGTPGGSPAGVSGGMSSAALATYSGQVVACVRPHIVFAVPEGTRPRQYVARFTVNLLPTGEQVGAPKLVKGSGLAAYDAAVERAIRRCDPFPSPRGSAPPRSLELEFDPVDTAR